MKVKVQDLTGLALVWAVATNSDYREVHLVYGHHDPEKARVPTQVMVSLRKDSSFWFRLDGTWVVEMMNQYHIGAGWSTADKVWRATHATAVINAAPTVGDAVAKCWLRLRGVEEVELPPEFSASAYPSGGTYGY